MISSQLYILYYAESFCGLSETYVYRTAQCLSSLAPTTILTHDRVHRDAFPDHGLDVRVEPRISPIAARAITLVRSWFACGIRDSHSLHSGLLLRVARQRHDVVMFAQFGLAARGVEQHHRNTIAVVVN
jgi:hypothetical protein